MIGVSGFFYDPSGYGEMARRFLGAARSITPTTVVGVATDGGTQMAFDMPPLIEGPLTDHVIVAAPGQFSALRTTTGRQIGYTCWETDRLPDTVLTACAAMDRLLVPSQQMVDTLAKHGLQAFRVSIPCLGERVAYRTALDILPVEGLQPGETIFYAMLTWQPRKNPLGLLTAFLTEFTGQDPVVLIVKVGGGLGDLQRAKAELARLLRAVALPHPPRVRLVGGKWTPEQVQALHVVGHCYVSLSRGEAFGIPMLDALVNRAAVISTDWGGQLDFLAEGVGTGRVALVESRLTPVVQEYPGFDGTQLWAEPSLLDAKLALRTMYQRTRGIDKAAAGWAQVPHFSEMAVALQILEALWPRTS